MTNILYQFLLLKAEIKRRVRIKYLSNRLMSISVSKVTNYKKTGAKPREDHVED
jgi:hypothetical protein